MEKKYYRPDKAPRNINPFTDFGFKKLFGEEANKDILLQFLNDILENDVGRIVDLEYSKNEHLGPTEYDRNVVFDIFCRTERGKRIIIEMQKFHQAFFKERSLYYSTFAIQEQAVKGDWDYSLYPVYCISLLDFKLKDENINPDEYLHKVKLLETKSGKVFNDKLNFVYVEIPKFNKNLDELETNVDKWMYLLTRLEYLERLPVTLQSKIFDKVMGIAELLKLEKTDRKAYEESLKKHRDLKNAMDSQKKSGIEEGIKKIAVRLFKENMDVQFISKVTGLSEDELQELFQKEGLD